MKIGLDGHEGEPSSSGATGHAVPQAIRKYEAGVVQVLRVCQKRSETLRTSVQDEKPERKRRTEEGDGGEESRTSERSLENVVYSEERPLRSKGERTPKSLMRQPFSSATILDTPLYPTV